MYSGTDTRVRESGMFKIKLEGGTKTKSIGEGRGEENYNLALFAEVFLLILSVTKNSILLICYCLLHLIHQRCPKGNKYFFLLF